MTDATAVSRIEEKQRINDSAYPILAQGQIEAAINGDFHQIASEPTA